MIRISFPISLAEKIVEAYEEFGITQTDVFFLCIRANERGDLASRMPYFVTREGIDRMLNAGLLRFVVPQISKENYKNWKKGKDNYFDMFSDIDLSEIGYQLINHPKSSLFNELFKNYPLTNDKGMVLKSLNEDEYKSTSEYYENLIDKSDNEFLHSAYVKIVRENQDHPYLNMRIDKCVKRGFLQALYEQGAEETKNDDDI